MSVRVQLPPGCSGFTCQDGTRYAARKGTSVVVEDHHARALDKGQHTSVGLISTAQALTLGTKKGRWCATCRRLWQAWSVSCPKCGNQTEEVT